MQKIIVYGLIGLFFYLPWFKGGKEIWAFSVFAIGILLVSMIKLSLGQKNVIQLPKNRIFLPLVLFLLWTLITTILSMYLYNSLWAWIRIIVMVSYGLLFLSSEDIYRYKLGYGILITLIAICFGESIIIFWQKIRCVTPSGSFTNVNHVAGLLVVGVNIVFSWILFSKDKKRFLGVLIIAVFVSAMIFTESRAGLLSLLVGITYLLFRKIGNRGLVISLAGVIVLFSVLSGNYWLKISKTVTPDPYAHQRLKIWSSTIGTITERPFLGTGLDNFEYVFWRHNFPVKFDPLQGNISRYSKFTPFVHNEFLQIASDMGIPALVIFVWILYILFVNKSKSSPLGGEASALRSSARREKGEGEIFAAESGLIVLLFQSFFDFNLHLPVLSITFVSLAGIIISESSEYKEFIIPDKINKWFRAFILLIMLAVVANFVADRYAQNSKWQEAVSWNPLNAEYWKHRGDSLAGKSDLKNAIKSYKYALLINPREPYYYEALGNCYYSLKQTYLAFKEYRQAVRLHPYNPFFHFQLGELFSYMQEYTRAIDEYKLAVRIEPIYYLAYYRQIQVYEKLKNVSESQKVKKQLMTIKQMISDIQPKNNYEKRLLDFDWKLVENMWLRACSAD